MVIAAEFGADIRPEIAAAAQEGREAFARTYYRRGRGQVEGVIGLTVAG